MSLTLSIRTAACSSCIEAASRVDCSVSWSSISMNAAGEVVVVDYVVMVDHVVTTEEVVTVEQIITLYHVLGENYLVRTMLGEGTCASQLYREQCAVR